MRTTLDIAEDVLAAAKELARRENKTAGEVISVLARAGLLAPHPAQAKSGKSKSHHGIRPFLKRRRVVITNEQVNKLRGGDAY